MDQDISADVLQDSNNFRLSKNEILTDDTDFDAISDFDEKDTSPDTDLFTDDEILSFEDDGELEIKTGDKVDENDVIFDDIKSTDLPVEDKESAPEKNSGNEDVPKLNRQEDIDVLFASVPDSNIKTSEDYNTPLNLDELDLQFDDTDLHDEDTAPEVQDETRDSSEGPEKKIEIDLADLEIEDGDTEEINDDTVSDTGISLEFNESDSAPEAEEELNIDLDELDMDIESDESPLNDRENETAADTAAEEDEEELTLNLDELDIDLDESPLTDQEDAAAPDKADDSDEDLTLNLDELDIDIDEIPVSGEKSGILHDDFSEDDEDLTLNLNELDIKLEDESIKSSLEEISRKPKIKNIEPEEEDESITIDLDTLDIDVTEDDIPLSIEDHEDEEKLTIDDAGITFDELSGNEEKSAVNIKKNKADIFTDETSPDDELFEITDDSTAHEIHIVDTLEELPEIDLDEYETYLSKDESPDIEIKSSSEENDINFDDIEIIPLDDDLDIYTSNEDYSAESVPGRGTTSLSIDFSLKYSRLGALLRLTGLYMISLIPHFIVLILYSAVSAILGFINQIVILFTGHCLEDFSQLTENTLRYLISIKTNLTGIIEDRPVFSGKENISHQLQMNITYPVKYSKNIAILRLSIIGIILFTLPHLAILALLTLTVPFVVISGLIIVIATGRWPGVLFAYLTKYFRYLTRLFAFSIGLNDEYPPFRFE
jgi:hypothetical protein